MSRHIILVALLACATACSRDVTAPEARPILSGSMTKIDTLRGTLRANADDANANEVVLITTDGDAVRLVGPVADLLRYVGSADVWVAGELTAGDEMIVHQYAFRGDGQPVCPEPIVRIIPEMGACEGGGALRAIHSPERARFEKSR